MTKHVVMYFVMFTAVFLLTFPLAHDSRDLRTVSLVVSIFMASFAVGISLLIDILKELKKANELNEKK